MAQGNVHCSLTAVIVYKRIDECAQKDDEWPLQRLRPFIAGMKNVETVF